MEFSFKALSSDHGGNRPSHRDDCEVAALVAFNDTTGQLLNAVRSVCQTAPAIGWPYLPFCQSISASSLAIAAARGVCTRHNAPCHNPAARRTRLPRTPVRCPQPVSGHGCSPRRIAAAVNGHCACSRSYCTHGRTSESRSLAEGNNCRSSAETQHCDAGCLLCAAVTVGQPCNMGERPTAIATPLRSQEMPVVTDQRPPVASVAPNVPAPPRPGALSPTC